MKAATHTTYGPPEVLELKEWEMPEPGQHEILVKLHACTVNRTDCANLTAKPFIMRFVNGLLKPKRPIPGTDFAGVVEGVGPMVTDYRPGERIWGFHDTGLSSQAEYMVISTRKAIAKIPDGISFEWAAASAEGAHYAINIINKVNIRRGQRALVNGGTGAIGSAAIQLLKVHNVKVTAVCRQEHQQQLFQLGADETIDYRQEDFTCRNELFDYVFDTVGKSSFFRCKRILARNGIYISSELGPYLQNLYLPAITIITGGKKVKFPLPRDIRRSLAYIGGLLEQGKFQPLIDRKYELNQIAEAYRYVMSGQKLGNVLISF